MINNLYTHFGDHGHGSVNLVLHEHGHTLDAIFKDKRLSYSRKWDKIMKETPGIIEFLDTLCTDRYCSENKEEGFAELFAYYHACEETRRHMEDAVPAMAEFFRNFDSVSVFKKKRFRLEDIFK